MVRRSVKPVRRGASRWRSDGRSGRVAAEPAERRPSKAESVLREEVFQVGLREAAGQGRKPISAGEFSCAAVQFGRYQSRASGWLSDGKTESMVGRVCPRHAAGAAGRATGALRTARPTSPDGSSFGFHFGSPLFPAEWKSAGESAPEARMNRCRSKAVFMRPAGARPDWPVNRWVRLSLRSSLPTGYPHWPRWGREARQPSSHSTDNSGESPSQVEAGAGRCFASRIASPA